MTVPNLDRTQVEALWVQHAASVRHFVLGVVRDAEIADEVLQQTFVTLLEQGHTADSETRKGWIFRVAFRHAMGLRRRAMAGIRALEHLQNALRRTPALDDSAVGVAMRREAIARVRAAIATLPPEQQQIVELRLRAGKTFAVIAAELGIPLNTALTRMRLATEKLRATLDHD